MGYLWSHSRCWKQSGVLCRVIHTASYCLTPVLGALWSLRASEGGRTAGMSTIGYGRKEENLSINVSIEFFFKVTSTTNSRNLPSRGWGCQTLVASPNCSINKPTWGLLKVSRIWWKLTPTPKCDVCLQGRGGQRVTTLFSNANTMLQIYLVLS